MKKHGRVNDVMNYSLTKVMSMSRRDLAKATSVLTQAANKRLARFKNKKITTPATEYIKKHGGQFSTKGKSVEQLREEYQRAKGFLESKTSTIKGFRTFENKISNTLKERTGINYDSLSEAQKRRFWQAYSKLEELDSANVYGAKYRTSVNEIYTAVKRGLRKKDIDKFVSDMNERIYKESTKNLFTEENDPFTNIDFSAGEIQNPFDEG